MIETLEIRGVATFGDIAERLQDLSDFNYVFGANGSGKTSISRVVAGPALYPDCKVTWLGGRELQAAVYNRDFIARNLDPASEIKGVFTLGEDTKDAIDKIADIKSKISAIEKEMDNLNRTLNGDADRHGKIAERDIIEDAFVETCWAQKLKHDDWCSVAFEGYRHCQARFRDKVLASEPPLSPEPADTGALKVRAASVFDKSATELPILTEPDGTNIVETEHEHLLTRPIIGSQDVDIAAMIMRLGSSDWVAQGRKYFDGSNGVCPFCQQVAPLKLAEDLAAYFDETFAEDTAAIGRLYEDYVRKCMSFEQQVETISGSPGQLLDVGGLSAAKAEFAALTTGNIERLRRKREHPSLIIQLEPIIDVISRIVGVIRTANADAYKHNVVVANIAAERRKLTNEVWDYIRRVELTQEISSYRSKAMNIRAAIASIEEKLRLHREGIISLNTEVRQLEATITRVLIYLTHIAGQRQEA